MYKGNIEGQQQCWPVGKCKWNIFKVGAYVYPLSLPCKIYNAYCNRYPIVSLIIERENHFLIKHLFCRHCLIRMLRIDGEIVLPVEYKSPIEVKWEASTGCPQKNWNSI